MMNRKLTNQELLNAVRTKASQERKLTVEIIELLQEVSNRDLHLQMGYSSMLKFCVEELKYSESAAYRRISAVRLIKDVPETKMALVGGGLTLQTVTQAQTFFNQEKKYFKKIYTLEQKRDLVQEIQFKSTRQVERLLAAKSPHLPKPEQSRQIDEDLREVTLTVRKSLDEKLDWLKSYYSHKNQNPTLAELLELMADEILQRKASSARRIVKSNVERSTSNPRFISAAKRHYIRTRDKGRCTFKEGKSGRTCLSQHLLEIDHIQPVSMGGSNAVGNLRLVCRAHNQMQARQIGMGI